MKLIDADLLVKNCKCTGKFEDNFNCVTLAELKKVIENQPTAFDVEEVIEELENLREVELHIPDMCDELGSGSGEIQYNDGRSQGRYEAFIEAIEIVKRGGRDEE